MGARARVPVLTPGSGHRLAAGHCLRGGGVSTAASPQAKIRRGFSDSVQCMPIPPDSSSGSSVPSVEARQTRIVLIGLSGSGKSTVGRELAQRLGRRFFDTDAAVCARSQLTIAEIVRRDGWDAFRRLEHTVLAEALTVDGAVVATGGGIVESADAAQLIFASALVVWLRAPVQLLLQRLATDTEARPLLASQSEEVLARMAHRREPLYSRIADFLVDTEDCDVNEVTLRIERVVKKRAR